MKIQLKQPHLKLNFEIVFDALLLVFFYLILTAEYFDVTLNFHEISGHIFQIFIKNIF